MRNRSREEQTSRGRRDRGITVRKEILVQPQEEPPPGIQKQMIIVKILMRKGWRLFWNEYLDKRRKIDFRVQAYRGARTPWPIEVQITYNGNFYLKLHEFIKMQSEHRNGCVKVYAIIADGVPPEVAAECIHTLMLRDLLRQGVSNSLMLLEVKSAKDFAWVNIYARNRELKEIHERKLASPERRTGTITRVSTSRRGFVILFESKRHTHRYYAPYWELADEKLLRQIQSRNVPANTAVTFIPTDKLFGDAAHFLAESVALAK